MMMKPEFKHFVRVACFFLIYLIIGSIAFNIALDGQKNAECPDWGFHLCYASNLALKSCSSDYGFYASGVHSVSFAFQRLGLSVSLFLAFLLAAMVMLIAHLTLKHGKTTAFFLYFMFFPFFMTFVMKKAPYLWTSMCYCGLVPYVTLTALSLLLLLEWKELGNWRIPIFLYALTVHNYALALLGIVLTALILRDLTKKWWILYAVPVVFSIAAGYGGLGDFATRLFVFFLLCVSVFIGKWFSPSKDEKNDESKGI